MYRLGGCPRCKGSQVYEPDTQDWACMTCGHRPAPKPLPYQAQHEVMARGPLTAAVKVLGLGIQARADVLDPAARSRYYDVNKAAMQRQYARIRAMRTEVHTQPELRKAARALAVFHKSWGLDSSRWSKLQRRWHTVGGRS